jgi:ABC-type antimicrobial peptide transport system permease subunit
VSLSIDLRCATRGLASRRWMTVLLWTLLALGSGITVTMAGFAGGLSSTSGYGVDTDAGSRFKTAITLLAGLSVLTVFVSVLTVAGQLVTRSRERRAETATRIACGAGPRQALRVFALDAILIALPGILLGAVLGW